MELHKNIKALHFKTRKALRTWLEKHHDTEASLWVIMYHKKSQTPSVHYEDVAEEGLCFGWIDSKANSRDAESYYLFFSKRKPKSVWSKINKARIEKLIAAGQMTSAGQQAIDLAKQNGSWNTLNASDNLEIPDDLKNAFAKHKLAKTNFDAFSASAKRILLEWIFSAKRPETREKRIRETVEAASQNRKAYPKSQ